MGCPADAVTGTRRARGAAAAAAVRRRTADRRRSRTIVAIVLGNTMTAVAVTARLALDTVKLRAGEVEAALSLGMSERDSRMEIIGQSATNALLPNLDSTRSVGLVTLPGAFVGVLLSTGSATQAGAVQILVLIALLLSQTCGVAAIIELVARGMITRVTR